VLEYEIGFILEQAMATSLHQDWRIDFDDPYEALEDWFRTDGLHPTVLNALVRDVDQLFAEEVE